MNFRTLLEQFDGLIQFVDSDSTSKNFIPILMGKIHNLKKNLLNSKRDQDVQEDLLQSLQIEKQQLVSTLEELQQNTSEGTLTIMEPYFEEMLWKVTKTVEQQPEQPEPLPLPLPVLEDQEVHLDDPILGAPVVVAVRTLQMVEEEKSKEKLILPPVDVEEEKTTDAAVLPPLQSRKEYRKIEGEGQIVTSSLKVKLLLKENMVLRETIRKMRLNSEQVIDLNCRIQNKTIDDYARNHNLNLNPMVVNKENKILRQQIEDLEMDKTEEVARLIKDSKVYQKVEKENMTLKLKMLNYQNKFNVLNRQVNSMLK